ncbi:DNA helicase IV [Vibrio quintilis]|nr:DNA helicase IV [Vibrio quintilis]
MQLQAGRTARYFIYDEFCQVEIKDASLIIRSSDVEETIPFMVWDGSIQMNRGIIWGQLQFFSREKEGVRYSWLVQGLPWHECRPFAEKALAAYSDWYQQQSVRFSSVIPQWDYELLKLISSPDFVSHAQFNQWHNLVSKDLEKLEMTFEELVEQCPEIPDMIIFWYKDGETNLEERNQHWTDTERSHWAELFSSFESSPLNPSQQSAVLLNDNNNLVLAGAGSGKTSVLSARVAYLMKSQLADAGQILMLSFGRDAADEMRSRLNLRIGQTAQAVTVNTFHQLGLYIIREAEGQDVQLSPVAAQEEQKQAWMAEWLKKHWMTPTNYKRWQKHLNQWPIAYIKGDEDLGSHAESPQLIAWLTRQVEQLSLSGMSKRSIQQKMISRDDYSRLNSELSLCWPCYQAWTQMLKETEQIDFNLMITRATEHVKKKRFKSPWRFIMVDEYQDISPPRLALLEALCGQQKNQGNLYAVGDDWQSIYQFTGSDVDLTTRFRQRFPDSSVTYLDTTYRFNQKIGEVANQFVQVNPNQLRKPLNSYQQSDDDAVFVMSGHRTEATLEQLNRQATENKSVLLLGRNHYHQPELLEDWQKRYTRLDIQFMTCHASKGKEADYVVITGVDEGQFPARIKMTHLDTALNASDDGFPDAEERRLFYVAMTRAKEKVWITYNASGSAFIRELAEGPYSVVIEK